MAELDVTKCLYDAFGDCEGHVGWYPSGRKCEKHRPPPTPVPDPEATYAYLHEHYGLKVSAVTEQLIDDRAVASGKRRASLHDYRDAQTREAQRRAARDGI